MPDPYLQAMMMGEFARKTPKMAPKVQKNRFDIAVEKHINAYIDTLDLENQYAHNPLVTPAIKRAQMRQELKENVQSSRLGQYLAAARDALKSHGQKHLQGAAYGQLMADIGAIAERMEELNLDTFSDEPFQTLLSIEDDTMEAIFQIAIGVFAEELCAEALALFIFLATLDPSVAGYWLRIGICAQQIEDYAFALRAYEMSCSLEPENISPHIFSIQCHLWEGNVDEASKKYEEASNIASTSDVEAEWVELLDEIKKELAGP